MYGGSLLEDIFAGAPPSRVPLTNSPLIRVLCQVRFDPILAIQKEHRLVEFQDALRSTYPRFSGERGRGIRIGQGQVEVSNENIIWRFSDPSDEYSVSLSK